MKAGSLDRVITVQRRTESRDEFGVVTDTWSTIATIRAQKVQASTTEFLQAAGTGAEATVIFRTRWLAGLLTTDRVTCDGTAHDIKELKELGRRKGLEIRTIARNVS